MCNKAVLENGTLKCVPDCYKNLGMCNKAVENYSHAQNLFLNVSKHV